MADAPAVANNSPMAMFANNAMARQLLMMVGIAASVAIGGYMVMWSQGQDFRRLYAGLEPDRANAVVESLQSMGIEHRLESMSGDVMVPAKQLHEARLKLAGAGLTDSGGGMDMLQEEKGFGVSEFMQSKKYHHALETELARTIQSMRQVRKARVHLAIPKQSVFVRDRRPPSASIMLDVYPGARIEREQVMAIINLAAASISELDPNHVTIVDQGGRLLSEQEPESELKVSARQYEYRRNIEQAYESRIQSLIAPITGTGNVRVQVAAEIDFRESQESRESWNPEARVVRSEQINTNGAAAATAAGAKGIPGALSNQPPSTANTTEAVAGAGSEQAVQGNQSITRNYEIERILNHTSRPAGSIDRLSVAVVVDSNPVAGGAEGEPLEPVSDEQIQAYTQLVKDAIGFNEERGDRVTVMSASFRIDPVLEGDDVEGPAFWEAAWFTSLIRQVFTGIVILLLVFMVLRPSMKSLINTNNAPPRTLATEAGGGQAGAGAGGQMALAGPNQMLGLDQGLSAVRSAVDNDPARIAQVVNQWVEADKNG